MYEERVSLESKRADENTLNVRGVHIDVRHLL